MELHPATTACKHEGSSFSHSSVPRSLSRDFSQSQLVSQSATVSLVENDRSLKAKPALVNRSARLKQKDGGRVWSSNSGGSLDRPRRRRRYRCIVSGGEPELLWLLHRGPGGLPGPPPAGGLQHHGVHPGPVHLVHRQQEAPRPHRATLDEVDQEM